MKWFFVDATGVAIVAIIAAAVVGCVEKNVKENLQPLVAVTGNYGVWSAAVGPTPAPSPSAACSTCRGTGKVLERPDQPQNKVYITCAACDGTGKEKTKDAPCTSGTCPPATRSIVR
jgi:hypothetical protein